VTKKSSGIVCSFVLFFSILCFGQTATTSLRGTVKDPAGAVVPGAAITLTSSANGNVMRATSNGSGDYQFVQIAPAKYTITVSATGFAAVSKVAELLVNQPATINFEVSVESNQVTVNVSAEAATLNTSDATLGSAFNNATIQALPSEGRNVPELLALQPGVLYLGHDNDQTNDSRSGSVNGGRSDQDNLTIDGLDDNDQTNGYAFTGVLRETLDSVEEFRVTTSNSNADAGRSSGAQISLVTKAGTNQFHGSAYEYHRPTFTVGNDWFNKQAQIASGEPNVPGKLIRNTFGGEAGGPILKDKLFFFANYEGQRTAENAQVTEIAPTATFQQGQLVYVNEGGSNTTLMPSDIAAMDAGCTANGTCPWGPGVDPNSLAVFAKQYPAANGSSVGDGGFNSGSYTFSSPNPATLNTSIAKFDYHLSDRQSLFVRGNLQKDTTAGTLQFPGQAPSRFVDDNTKGIAAGHTWTITPTLVNDFRYGYIRQGFSDRGTLQGDVVTFRFLNQPQAQTRTLVVHVPVHNVVDNMSWTKGGHTLQWGVNWRLIHNSRDSSNNSFSGASTNEYWLVNGGAISGQGGSLDPAAFGYPAVCSDDSCGGAFNNSYDIAAGLITGLVPETDGQYNYSVSKDLKTGVGLADGAFLNHDFKANEFEYYLQDSWRVTPKLTVTVGLRHSLLQTPYEINGQQVAPTVNMHDWFGRRAAAAAAGSVFEENLTFAPSGQANGLKPYWPMQKTNIAPRLAVAYAPNAKTSIRAGGGMFYDHFGQGIINSFDQFGSFGITTAVSTPASTYSVDTSPRFTAINALPSLPPGLAPLSTITYPYTPSPAGFAITWGIDDKIKTPYSLAADLSVERELGKGFVLETAYVGRFGRHLLQELDLAEPVNLRDGSGGGDYYTAATALSKAVDRGDVNVAPIAYWEDLFPYLATGGMSATQNIYQNLWQFYRGNETSALQLLDQQGSCDPANGGLGCGPQQFRFFQPQFSSLYAWSSIGTSSYNALQFVLRHEMSRGLEMDLSYTFSKSLDLGSDAERANELAGVGSGSSNGAGFSEILNSFNPKLNKGVSDFDTRSLVTANWVYLVPVGRGQQFAGTANTLLDTLIGGWQWSGLYRWTSGLPFSIFEPGWSTNFQEESGMVQTGPVPTHRHVESNGSPQVFANPSQLAVRLPYPGEAGNRNNFRGDGYFDIDSGLNKTFKLWEAQSLKFAWEVFNVTNSVRFDTNPSTSLGDVYTSGSLGNYSATLTKPRKMQFSLRYSF
jgi:hypothetical protein